jgi:hypothetical protein
MIAGLAGFGRQDPFAPLAREASVVEGRQRRLSVYSGHAAFSLATEIEHLSRRAIEANIYFNPRFLAPAIPRLDDREVRLAVLRDESDRHSRLRFMMPYTVERPVAGSIGPAVIRSWATVFGPGGTPLIDGDDPAGTVDEVLDMLSRPHLGLPGVLVIPDIHAEGPAARTLRAGALLRDFPVHATRPVTRACLETRDDADDYLRSTLSSHHRRGFGRLLRRLGEKGEVEFNLTRDVNGVFERMEEFLALEAKGWKGARRTAMASDRMQAAFARETVNGLALLDMMRILTLDLDGRAIASLLIMIERGTAYTWKIAFDEAYAAYSPGMLLMIEATRMLIDDPNVERADSCAAPDHPMMDRVWSERRRIETLVIGLGADKDAVARRALGHIEFNRSSRRAARGLVSTLQGIFRR